MPGFKLQEAFSSLLAKFETLSPDQVDSLIDDALELIEEIEVRLLKAESLFEGITQADSMHHRDIEVAIG